MNLHSTNIHHPPSSSDPEETPNSLDGEISGFTSLLPVSNVGFARPKFFTGNGSSFAVFRLLLTTFSQRYLGQVSFLCVSVDFAHLFFSSSTLFGETVMIFGEPGIEDLASLVPSF